MQKVELVLLLLRKQRRNLPTRIEKSVIIEVEERKSKKKRNDKDQIQFVMEWRLGCAPLTELGHIYSPLKYVTTFTKTALNRHDCKNSL